jgi:phenylacetic acid degradation operon negative regulatory protein
VNARSALFDLYGDHLRRYGGEAPVAALVRLLAPLGVAAPAVRTAVSRMVRQGWLSPVRLADGPGYTLTPRAVRRLDDAAARIYRTRREAWDGTWHLIVTALPGERSRRDRVRAGLTFLGYAQLGDGTWIGPRWSDEVDVLFETESVTAERFQAAHDGDSLGLVQRAWDLEGLSHAYTRWLADEQTVVAGTEESSDEDAFAARSRLVHEWRKFLFLDPGLPRELLPQPWAGERAADFFDAENARLRPASTRFVERCLSFQGPSNNQHPNSQHPNSQHPTSQHGGSPA